MKKLNWEALKPGDIVDVVAPAGKPKPHTLQGVESFLHSWGLKARLPRDTVQRDLLCANSRGKRFQHLKKALLAKDSKMIWCLRGGYGSLHLLDDLKKIKPRLNKCFLGYSDITSLHNFFIENWGWSTLHGPNIDRFALNIGTKSEANRLRRILFGQDLELQFNLKALNQAAEKNKLLRAPIVGGNLITLQSSFGTPYQLHGKACLLFVEDIGERAYRIDRVFEHMRQLGILKNIRGLILGQFTEANEPNGKNILPQYFRDFATRQKIPVLSGLPCGHGKHQQTLPLGTTAKLQLGDRPQLIVKTGVRKA